MVDARDRRTEEPIAVWQKTAAQVSWTEQERGAPGAFTIQLVLDGGAAEYVLRVTAADAEVLARLLETHRASCDVGRKVLMFELGSPRARAETLGA